MSYLLNQECEVFYANTNSQKPRKERERCDSDFRKPSKKAKSEMDVIEMSRRVSRRLLIYFGQCLILPRRSLPYAPVTLRTIEI
jgi:hypothetical protein